MSRGERQAAGGGAAPLRVLQVVPSYWPAVRYGGPIVSVHALCRALVQAGVAVDVATTNCDGPLDLDVPTDRWVEKDGVRLRYFRRWPRIDYAFSPALTAFLARHAGDYDLVHVTSTFSWPTAAAGWAARRAGVPYVVSPRGSLQRWSLGQKRWKKLPYWALLERRNLERAAALHATADLEEEELRAVLPAARIVVSPNGMDPVEVPPVARSGRRLVFLGRVHLKKGLDVLARAVSLLQDEWPDLDVVIAGPDDTGERPRVEAIVEGLSPRPRLRWIGPVGGEEKWRLLASATAFVLPSHSENFGMAVVEALACGTPVVVSRHTPWQVAEARGAGLWVENTPERLAEALRAILSDPARAAAMGEAARRLAAEYQWPALGRELAGVFGRLAAEHPRAAR